MPALRGDISNLDYNRFGELLCNTRDVKSELLFKGRVDTTYMEYISTKHSV